MIFMQFQIISEIWVVVIIQHIVKTLKIINGMILMIKQ